MKQLYAWMVRAGAFATAAVPAIALAQLSGSPNTFGGPSDLISGVVRIVNWFLVVAGLVAAIFLIIGGVQYIVSRGDEDAAEKAKNTILYAIIGLVVIGLAAAIVNFVVTGVVGA